MTIHEIFEKVNAGPDTDLPPFKSILDEVENKKT